MLTTFNEFIIKWKLYFQGLDDNLKPKCGSSTLILSRHDEITVEMQNFIGIYVCRNKTRRNWFENECAINFLQSSQQRQILLQFEPKGSKKESILDISTFPDGIFSLDSPWEDEVIGKDKKCCLICLESVSNRLIRGDISVCDHIFCVDCISRWSTIQNKCPACKRVFTEIRTQERLTNSSKKRKLERIFPVSPDSTRDSPPPSPPSPSDHVLHSADYWYHFVSNETVMSDYLFRLFGEESVNLNHDAYRPMFYRNILSQFGILPNSPSSRELYNRDASNRLELEEEKLENTE
jgi:hypothetical protein